MQNILHQRSSGVNLDKGLNDVCNVTQVAPAWMEISLERVLCYLTSSMVTTCTHFRIRSHYAPSTTSWTNALPTDLNFILYTLHFTSNIFLYTYPRQLLFYSPLSPTSQALASNHSSTNHSTHLPLSCLLRRSCGVGVIHRARYHDSLL